jgi:toxin ParE1/3/4
MTYNVLITKDAGKDLEALYEYLFLNEVPGRADHVLEQIERKIEALKRMPERGAYPGELSALGIKEYREVFFKPYRIIYRIISKNIYIMLIADGRRDMQSLLGKRFLIH